MCFLSKVLAENMYLKALYRREGRFVNSEYLRMHVLHHLLFCNTELKCPRDLDFSATAIRPSMYHCARSSFPTIWLSRQTAECEMAGALAEVEADTLGIAS